ncbi:MAG: recombinase family protein [Burkholderiaceae bacterium]|jgi:DNA invertase Pin-like site-specific DNA recombinase|nr:recombinase family protein [Burkholderiaceae bacterium]
MTQPAKASRAKSNTRAPGALVGYARVSTPEQDLTMQVKALNGAGCVRIFEDVASGAKADRPGLDAALAYLRPGDTLAVWKIDRLGRSLAHLVEVVESLQANEIGFRSLTDTGIDTTTPSGKLIFHIFAALAAFERELIRERTKAALAVAKARGRRGGRKVTVTADVLDRAMRLIVHKGLTVPQAASVLKVGRSTLYRAWQAQKPTLCT